ncbi:hypothetical protein OIU84_001104 [Salix udensis]|uniref:Short-chain dehydrogenase TIC 32, chloroplastic-like n=1 Tax=Salix udensis TaxID=889485 RepID=A0AAD6K629_9ROSI|nr:hypothetical protein OIU84_001104 [Salix udensis]
MATPFMLSKDNIELQFATNHVGHFLLTNLLMETIRKTASASRKEGRIVNVSSRRHQFSYLEGIRFAKLSDPSGYNSLSAYGQSKLANILHANEIARQLKEDRVEVTANSVHPGLIATNLFRHYSFVTGEENIVIENYWPSQSQPYLSEAVLPIFCLKSLVGLAGKFVIKNVQQGAATTCYVALHPEVKGMSGQYFADSNIAKASLQANDAELAKKLWDFSLDLVRRGTNPS